jgi:hypothetical protein
MELPDAPRWSFMFLLIQTDFNARVKANALASHVATKPGLFLGNLGL